MEEEEGEGRKKLEKSKGEGWIQKKRERRWWRLMVGMGRVRE